MPLLELFDETLDINSTENYELSVQVSFDDLSFSILDTLRNKFIMLRDYEPDKENNYNINDLHDIITRDDFLTRHYKKINVITPSPKSTLIPEPLYEETKRDEYFAFNQIVQNGETIMTNGLAEPDSILVFSLQNQIADLIKEKYINCQCYHQLKPLFRFMSITRRSEGNDYVHVHLERDFLNIVIFDQNSLNFCNSFNYKTFADIQYYVMYILKKMNIDPGDPVFFSGRTNNKKEVISGFSNYLSRIRFAEPSGNFTFSYVFNETDLHKYLTLFTVTSCG